MPSGSCRETHGTQADGGNGGPLNATLRFQRGMRPQTGVAMSRRDPSSSTELLGASGEGAAAFDFDTAAYLTDDRQDYGEYRIVAVGYLDRRLHVLCFVEIGHGIRVISFRKANLREARKHGKALTLNQ